MMSEKKLTHCRKYGWLAGDCERLTCSRCGKSAYARLQARIIHAATRQPVIFFVTIYFNPRQRQDLSDLPLFKDQKIIDEKLFRQTLGKVFRALRDKARRSGCSFEYVLVLALSKVKHKLHKVIHSHALITWLPDLQQRKGSRRKERVECPFLDEKLKRLHMTAWVEIPRQKQAVARYTAQNAKTIIGKPDYKNVRIYRFSEGFEQ